MTRLLANWFVVISGTELRRGHGEHAVVVDWDDFFNNNDSLFLARGSNCGVNERFFLEKGTGVSELSGQPSGTKSELSTGTTSFSIFTRISPPVSKVQYLEAAEGVELCMFFYRLKIVNSTTLSLNVL